MAQSGPEQPIRSFTMMLPRAGQQRQQQQQWRRHDDGSSEAAAAAAAEAGQQPRTKVSVLIVGAGPTGLGAATRLHQHGVDDWLLVERAAGPGGLACTAVTPQGFSFDMGGHVIFSHYAYFDELVDAALLAEGVEEEQGEAASAATASHAALGGSDRGGDDAARAARDADEGSSSRAAVASTSSSSSSSSGSGAWNVHQRASYVRLKGRWVAYPFQNNIAALDKPDQERCLAGLVDAAIAAAGDGGGARPRDFGEWIDRTMGEGIAALFMRPYNFKVWATRPEAMACGWLGERVARVDVRRAIGNVVHGREDAGWGPNATFRFPRRGGTGAIWRGVARLLPAGRQRYGVAVTSLDVDAKVATLSDGGSVEYGALVCTAPLDATLRGLGRGAWADGLAYSSTHIVGVGVRGACPHAAKCWLYFPEPDCPFYRATVFSNYAAANCPPAGARLATLCRADGGAFVRDGARQEQQQEDDGQEEGGPYWSLMFEVSESGEKPVDQAPVALGGGAAGTWPSVVRDTLLGAVATQLLQAGDEVVSLFHRRLQHGYPTPSLGRDAVLDEALPWLQARGIWSRGRFGSYKYEVGNQDHSLMLGVEAADSILFGADEPTLHQPDAVNGRRNEQPRYADTAPTTPTATEPLAGRPQPQPVALLRRRASDGSDGAGSSWASGSVGRGGVLPRSSSSSSSCSSSELAAELAADGGGGSAGGCGVGGAAAAPRVHAAAAVVASGVAAMSVRDNE